jgi:hypothetical protein
MRDLCDELCKALQISQIIVMLVVSFSKKVTNPL